MKPVASTDKLSLDTRDPTSTPQVSVLALCYNHAAYVTDCLESILAQSFRDFELIVIDDASVDGSPLIIRQALEHCDRPVLFLPHRENRGLMSSLNEGLRHTRGKYLAMIATDDLLEPEKLRVQVALAEDAGQGIGMVYSDAHTMDAHGTQLNFSYLDHFEPSHKPIGNDPFKELVAGRHVPMLSTLIFTDALRQIGGFDERLAHEDGDTQLRIAARFGVRWSDYISATYRMHQGSLRTTMPQQDHLRSELLRLRRWLGYRRDTDILIKRQLAFTAYALAETGVPDAKRELWQVVRESRSPMSLALAISAQIGIPFRFWQRANLVARRLRGLLMNWLHHAAQGAGKQIG